MRKIVHTVVRKIHHAGYLAAKRWRSFWVSSAIGECGENLKVLGAPKLLYPANIAMGDNCTLNHGVVIDARAKVTIGSNVRISSYSLIETAYLNKDTGTPRTHDAKEIITSATMSGLHRAQKFWPASPSATAPSSPPAPLSQKTSRRTASPKAFRPAFHRFNKKLVHFHNFL